MPELVITAVGPDRVGLAADFSRRVVDAGGNLASSRMVNLSGRFALLALVQGDAAVLDRVQAALRRDAESLGLKLEIAELAGAAGTPRRAVPYRLRTYSADRPGIVAPLTDVLRKHGVNVEELETRVESAPFAGTPLFLLEALVSVPEGLSPRQLRADLEAVGDTLGCDVDLDPA